MTNRKRLRRSHVCGLSALAVLPSFLAPAAMPAAAASALLLTACGGEEEPPPPPPPPPAPPRFEWSDVDADYRVQFNENAAPSDAGLGEAIADLATAIATGDDGLMADVLMPEDRRLLERQVEEGDWERATESIEAVRVSSVAAQGNGTLVALAVQDASGVYLLGWLGTNASGEWQFTGLELQQPSASSIEAFDNEPVRPKLGN